MDTPGSIPNTEVKHRSGDDSPFGDENSAPPGFFFYGVFDPLFSFSYLVLRLTFKLKDVHKIYFLVRLLVLALFPLILIPLTVLFATGQYSIATDPSYQAFLIYIDLALSIILFVPEIAFFLFKRKKYEGFWLLLSSRDQQAGKIAELIAILLSAVGFVLLISALLTTLSGDMIILSAMLIVYGGLYLVYRYLSIPLP